MEPQEIESLVLRWRGTLFSVAYAVLGDYADAEDAVAEALVRIVRQGRSLRDPEKFGAWARRIASNEARAHRGSPERACAFRGADRQAALLRPRSRCPCGARRASRLAGGDALGLLPRRTERRPTRRTAPGSRRHDQMAAVARARAAQDDVERLRTHGFRLRRAGFQRSVSCAPPRLYRRSRQRGVERRALRHALARRPRSPRFSDRRDRPRRVDRGALGVRADPAAPRPARAPDSAASRQKIAPRPSFKPASRRPTSRAWTCFSPSPSPRKTSRGSSGGCGKGRGLRRTNRTR